MPRMARLAIIGQIIGDRPRFRGVRRCWESRGGRKNRGLSPFRVHVPVSCTRFVYSPGRLSMAIHAIGAQFDRVSARLRCYSIDLLWRLLGTTGEHLI